jgi:hypothetical protein
MTYASNGNYVATSDYDRLDETLNQLLALTTSYFDEIQSGNMTAQDAAIAISVWSKLRA